VRLAKRGLNLLQAWIDHRHFANPDGGDSLVAVRYRPHEFGTIGVVPDVDPAVWQTGPLDVTEQPGAESTSRPPINGHFFVHVAYLVDWAPG